MPAPVLALLGDSTLDNASYARPEPDTAVRLERLLPAWSVLRLARDGATMGDVPDQLRALGRRASVAVLSVGGNDALAHAGLLERRSGGAAEVLDELLAIAEDFGARYEALARSVATRAERTILCTIYEAPLEPAAMARIARVPVALLADRIVRAAARLGLDALDLRAVCTEPGDFAMQIEPSARGAEKIARAIARLAEGSSRAARIFAG